MHINETVIDMAGDGWNVNEEYERLFGAAKRVNLFDTEEEYNELRRFIMDQPQLTFVNPAMPFGGVCDSIRQSRYKNKKKEIQIKQELAQLVESLKKYSAGRDGKRNNHLTISKKVAPIRKSKTDRQDKIVEQNKKVSSVKRPPRYYFIKRKDLGSRSCFAKGMYDKIADKFIILEGSELAYEVTSKYRFSASDIKRKKIIQQHCDSKNILRLKRDVTCNTPDEAACFVLGDFADGWVEWKSKEGLSLKSFISKV